MLKDKLMKYPILLLVIIVCFGLILRLIFFSGYVEGDDTHYIAQAYKYSIGEFKIDTNTYIASLTWALRSMMTFPTALFLRLFGVSEISVVLFDLCKRLYRTPSRCNIFSINNLRLKR